MESKDAWMEKLDHWELLPYYLKMMSFEDKKKFVEGLLEGIDDE